MEQFEWAWNNLAARTPGELEHKGLRVFTAPNVPTATRLVNLADGRVFIRKAEQEPPTDGHFAEVADLERFCLEQGFPLSEVNGQMSLLAVGHREAGDPLGHAGD